jgi:hypothetical protein
MLLLYVHTLAHWSCGPANISWSLILSFRRELSTVSWFLSFYTMREDNLLTTVRNSVGPAFTGDDGTHGEFRNVGSKFASHIV